MIQLKALTNLTEELVKLPTIGQKTAERLALYLLNKPTEQVMRLSDALIRIKKEIICCSECFSISQNDPCYICSSLERDKSVLCVVEEPHDLFAIEKAGEFKGLYFVLQGALSPLDGIGPEDLNIKRLLDRIKSGSIKEAIMATNPTLEGEATAMYISKLLKPMNIRVTRIARGLPVGGDFEYADEATVMRSFQGRMEF